MAYKLENFLIQVSETDKLLKIKDSNGLIKYTIDGYSVTSLRAINNIVKIITKSNTIDLDFLTNNEARIALSRIQGQLDLLKEKMPLFIDKKISNYVSEFAQGATGPQGFADRYSATSSTPLQVPDAGYVANLVTQTSLAYTPGQSVLVYNTLTENYMIDDYVEGDSSISFIGLVDDYVPSTGELQLVVSSSVGFGLTDSNNETATYSFWYINITGQSGQSVGSGSTFSSLEVYGLSTFQQTTEVLNDATESGLSPSTIFFDFNDGSIWYIDTIGSDFIADFINLPTTDNRVTTGTIVIPQGVTAYVPVSVFIDGSPVTTLWGNGATAVGNPNQTDIIGFSFFRYGGTWSNVLAQLNTFL
jgi:hypothetical protein